MGDGRGSWVMRSVHFDAQGFTRTYSGLLQRLRAFFLRVSFVRGGISVAAGRTSGRDFGKRAKHCVGARHLLCSSHSFELEIRLHHPHRFLNPDYSVFDCGGVAFSEAGFLCPALDARKNAHITEPPTLIRRLSALSDRSARALHRSIGACPARSQ